MAKYPSMPLWTDAYLGDTTHLTTIEHGTYLLLLIAMWRNDGSLPNDDRVLARYARLTPGQWKRIKPVVWPFFDVSSDSIMQGRLTDELVAVRQNSAKQSDRAKSRWLKNNDTHDAAAMPQRMPDECRDDAGSMPPISIPKREEIYRRPNDIGGTAREPPDHDDDDRKSDLEAGPPEAELRTLLAAGGIANPMRSDLVEARRWLTLGLPPARIRPVLEAVRQRAPEQPRSASYFAEEVEREASQPPPAAPMSGEEQSAAHLQMAAARVAEGRRVFGPLAKHGHAAALIERGLLTGWEDAIARGFDVDRSRIPRSPRPAAE